MFQLVKVEDPQPEPLSQEAPRRQDIKKARIFSNPSEKIVNPELDITTPLLRKRLRACFVFARPRQSVQAQPKGKRKR